VPSPLEAIIPATVGALEGRFGPLLAQGWELTVRGKRGQREAVLSPPTDDLVRQGAWVPPDVSATGRDLLSAFNLLHENCVAAGVL